MLNLKTKLYPIKSDGVVRIPIIRLIVLKKPKDGTIWEQFWV
jgi:hypothetical protein